MGNTAAHTLVEQLEDGFATSRAWRLADARAIDLIESHGIRLSAWEYRIEFKQTAENDELMDAILHLQWRELGHYTETDTAYFIHIGEEL